MDRVKTTTPTIAIVMFIGGVIFAAPASASPLEFSVPAGPAAETLTQFGYESGLDVFFDATNINTQTTQAVSGRHEPEEALRMMLVGSGLTFSVTRLGVISVVLEPSAQHETHEPFGPQLPSGSQIRGATLTYASWDTKEVRIEGDRPNNDLPTDVSAEVLNYTRKDLDGSGATTAQDWLQTLPFNFGGGPNEGTHFGPEAMTNTAFGSGANLRGLGSRVTVILVNGRRLAPSGAEGTFTDIGNIPFTAVDHIQVVTDGASTLYGEDAIGGVINFVLRGTSNARETQAEFGGPAGSLGERLYSQAFSGQLGQWRGLFSVEYYQRDALFASERARANSDLRAWGGQNLDTPFGNPGTIIDDTGQQWGIPAGQNGVGLQASDLIPGKPNLYSRHLDETVLPRQQRLSVIATGERPVSNNSSAWVEALFSRRRFDAQKAPITSTLTVPAGTPFYVNPGKGDSVQVEYGFADDLGPVAMTGHVDSSRVSAGFDYEAPRDWKVTGSLAYSEERQLVGYANLVDFDALQQALDTGAFNPFGDGSHTTTDTLNSIRVTGKIDYRSVFGVAKLSASGSAVSLPAGDLRLTVGGEYGVQSFKSSVGPSSIASAPDTNSRRNTTALYAQATAPIFKHHSGADPLPWLSLSLGVRDEFYSDVGRSFAPQAELTFRPAKWATFRTGIAKLFRPPNLPDQSETANISAIFPFPDPHSPTGVTNALAWTGGNTDLKPESAQTIVAGWDFAPTSHPSLSASLNYFHTVFANRIETIDLPGDVFIDPQDSWLISRNIGADVRAQVCAHSRFLTGSQQDCLSAPIDALIDVRTQNAATLKTDGIDLRSRYERDTSFGRLDFRLIGAYVLHYREAHTPLSPIVDLRNTDHYPIALRLRGTAGLEYRSFRASAGVNFQGRYTDIGTTPRQPVSSWMTTDLTLGYGFRNGELPVVDEVELSLSVENLFNSSPPYLYNTDQNVAYDQENGNLLGRQVRIRLQTRW
jgi:iron complex outermembrane receptor protein